MNIAGDKNGASVRTHCDARFWLEKARKNGSEGVPRGWFGCVIAVGEFSSLLVGDFVLLVHTYAKQSKVD